MPKSKMYGFSNSFSPPLPLSIANGGTGSTSAEEAREALGIYDPSRWRRYLYEPSGNSGQEPGVVGLAGFTFLGTAQNGWDSDGTQAIRGRAQVSSAAEGFAGQYGNANTGRMSPSVAIRGGALLPLYGPIFEEIYSTAFTFGFDAYNTEKTAFVGFRALDDAGAPSSGNPTLMGNAIGLAQCPGDAELLFLYPGVSGPVVLNTGVSTEDNHYYELSVKFRIPELSDLGESPGIGVYTVIRPTIRKTKFSGTEEKQTSETVLGECLVKSQINRWEHLCAYRYSPLARVNRCIVHRIEINQRIF